LLFVSRMTPENCAHILIEAYQQSGSERQLVIVGDAPYVDDYKKLVRSMASRNANIILTGYLFGADYRQISSHCSFFVLPAGIDGTRPVLLDQMAFGNCVVVRDTAANLEVIGDAGISFSAEDDINSLADVIRGLESDDLMIETMRRRALERVESVYSWERITDQYEALFESMGGPQS
jgi:glycosyltransferase involved in cell wall biosynthesis